MNSKSGRGDWIRTSDPCAQVHRCATSGNSLRRQPLQVVDFTLVRRPKYPTNPGVTLLSRQGDVGSLRRACEAHGDGSLLLLRPADVGEQMHAPIDVFVIELAATSR